MSFKKKLSSVLLLFFLMGNFCMASSVHEKGDIVEDVLLVEVEVSGCCDSLDQCCEKGDVVLRVRDEELIVDDGMLDNSSLVFEYPDLIYDPMLFFEVIEERALVENLEILSTIVILV